MKLSDLRDLPLDTTDLAEGAWSSARRRQRRRAAVGASVAVATLAAGSAAGLWLSGESGPEPAPSPPSSTGTTSPTPIDGGPEPMSPDVVTDPLVRRDYARLVAEAPRLEIPDATELTSDPVDRAVLATVPDGLSGDDRYTSIYVLGDDGGWRSVDQPELQPTSDGLYEDSPLRVTSLSADGRRLALPQKDAVIVVDLTSGGFETFPVPGLNQELLWQDDTHVLVSTEQQRTGRTVDLRSGEVEKSEFTQATRFQPDGSWLSWSGYEDPRVEHSQNTVLTSSDGSYVITRGNNVGGLGGQTGTSPLVDGDVAVGLGALRYDRHRSDGSVMNVGDDGPVVVDRASGDVLGFLPLPPASYWTRLLALDGSSVLASLSVPQGGFVMVRWDWAARTVDPVAALPGEIISWAGPVESLPQ